MTSVPSPTNPDELTPLLGYRGLSLSFQLFHFRTALKIPDTRHSDASHASDLDTITHLHRTGRPDSGGGSGSSVTLDSGTITTGAKIAAFAAYLVIFGVGTALHPPL